MMLNGFPHCKTSVDFIPLILVLLTIINLHSILALPQQPVNSNPTRFLPDNFLYSSPNLYEYGRYSSNEEPPSFMVRNNQIMTPWNEASQRQMQSYSPNPSTSFSSWDPSDQKSRKNDAASFQSVFRNGMDVAPTPLNMNGNSNFNDRSPSFSFPLQNSQAPMGGMHYMNDINNNNPGLNTGSPSSFDNSPMGFSGTPVMNSNFRSNVFVPFSAPPPPQWNNANGLQPQKTSFPNNLFGQGNPPQDTSRIDPTNVSNLLPNKNNNDSITNNDTRTSSVGSMNSTEPLDNNKDRNNSTLNTQRAHLNSTFETNSNGTSSNQLEDFVKNPTSLFKHGSVSAIVIAIVLILTGGLMNLFGHKLFKAVLFLAGFYFMAIVSLYILNLIDLKGGLGDKAYLAYIITPLVSGLLGGILFVFLWKLGLFAVGALFGFTLSLFILTFIPQHTIFHQSIVVKMVFMSVFALVFGILIFFIETTLLILGTSFPGAYLVFFGIDLFVQTGFTQTVQSIFTFSNTNSIPKIQGSPALYGMLGGFIALSIFGTVIQLMFHRTRGYSFAKDHSLKEDVESSSRHSFKLSAK